MASHERERILAQTKHELRNLVERCVEIEKVTPLVFEEEQVVVHLRHIEEFFDQLSDNLGEVKEYMLALQEQVEESDEMIILTMVPCLATIVDYLKKLCPLDSTPGATPGGLLVSA